ncbi:ABC transporter transmembrane region domain-containing protein [Ditylenchus destructor]|uniref:ABC transporter transmembrane region domain-containing protein n=1 Tax=Ditylenchus destructor TaxID=166010 RepID=A0AAD4QUH9_9BILA|nr:ABC transporter transmembrane region domain-containing protein [Ditylenchus destructor]
MDLHVGYFTGQRKEILSQGGIRCTSCAVFGHRYIASARLTFFSLLVIPISAFFIARIVKNLKSQARSAQESYGNMISYLDEALSGVKIIKAFNAVSFIKNRFHNENERYANIGVRWLSGSK